MPSRYYPKSVVKLLLIGFGFVALPLVFALANSAVSIEQLANHSQKTVYGAVRATQASRHLIEIISHLERNAHQIVILADDSLIDTYTFNREQLQNVAQELVSLNLDSDSRGLLSDIVAGEANIFSVLSYSARKTNERRQVVEEFTKLRDWARDIETRSNQKIESETNVLRERADAARQIMHWQMFALVPLILVVVGGATIFVARPIREIDFAIRQLGYGRLKDPIIVSGPQDLVYLGNRLEWMRKELYGLQERKNRFLRQVAHELKTPLAAVAEGVSLFSDGVIGRISDEQKEIIDILQKNTRKLHVLIENLLDYGALQFRTTIVELGHANILTIVERVVDDRKLEIQKRNLNVKIICENRNAIVDAEKIRVILDNLLSNAIKFSPSGAEICIDIETGENNLSINVIDNGPGIDPNDEARIFDPFIRGYQQGEGTLRGSGLGLSIVQECVNVCHGTIELIRTRGNGTHFRVTLPIEKGEL